MTPNALETWFKKTNFVFFEINFLNSFKSNSPSPLIGITFSFDLVFLHIICKGTMFE